MFVLLTCLTLVCTRLLWTNYSSLNSLQMIEKYGNMYVDVPFKRDKPMVLKFPFFLAHRMIYCIIASALFLHVTFSLQVFVLLSLLLTAYTFNFRNQGSVSQHRLILVTAGCLHMMFLQLFLFTDFVSNIVAQLYFCLTYIGLICVVFIVNISFMIVQSIQRYLMIRRWKAIKE